MLKTTPRTRTRSGKPMRRPVHVGCRVWSVKRSRQNSDEQRRRHGIVHPQSRHQARSHGYLFVVADGVGGLDLGEIASSTAVSVLIQEFEKAQGGAMLISLLPRLVQHANAAVHDRTLAPEFRGKKMATTAGCMRTSPRPGDYLSRGRLALLSRAQGHRKANHAGSHLGQ